jgi:hypothetical protein
VPEDFEKLPPEGETRLASKDNAPKMGRPRAKKSDPAYVQAAVYLHRDVHVVAKSYCWMNSAKSVKL